MYYGSRIICFHSGLIYYHDTLKLHKKEITFLAFFPDSENVEAAVEFLRYHKDEKERGMKRGMKRRRKRQKGERSEALSLYVIQKKQIDHISMYR